LLLSNTSFNTLVLPSALNTAVQAQNTSVHLQHAALLQAAAADIQGFRIRLAGVYGAADDQRSMVQQHQAFAVQCYLYASKSICI
jgi:hypothetical protein